MENPKILIINLGSQYTLVIARTLRELGVRSAVLSPEQAGKWLKNNKPEGIILSGGPASVYEEDAPSVPKEVFSLRIPLLGICYGMHLIVHELGGEVHAELSDKEYGEANAEFHYGDELFQGIKGEHVVWASHGDTAKRLPLGFRAIASSPTHEFAAISNLERRIWGVQFHPEVPETIPGKMILENFVFRICNGIKDWDPQDIVDSIREKTMFQMSRPHKAIIAFSGGVDSSTLSAILSPVLGENLRAVCIDAGQMRQGEMEEVKANAQIVGVNLKIVRASNRFQKALGNTINAEVKRKRFKKLYTRILIKEAKQFWALEIIQASLAPDFIESGELGGAVIKSHHNTGLDFGTLQQLHPFRDLFKYEIMELARLRGLPDSISQRQPFPGPGLFVRVIGQPPTPKRLRVLRWADAEVRRILQERGEYNKTSQLVVALLCAPTVGVKGDDRAYAYMVAVRGINTSDFMTGYGTQFSPETRREISSCLTKHPEIIHVGFYEGDKPPTTIEFE